MRITYDPWADAVSFHIGSTEKGIVDYTDVDGDTIIHFDSDNRIVELEVLAASQRLDLDFLLPEITLLVLQRRFLSLVSFGVKIP